MSAFQKKLFSTENYENFRPRYPEDFFGLLRAYNGINKAGATFQSKESRALDLGCGTGVASYPLLEVIDNVIGIDPSHNMIAKADSLKQKFCEEKNIDHTRIQFRVGRTEDLLYSVVPESFDLIIVAQCAHWFDIDAFFKNSAALLKKGGTLAYWYYGDPFIVDFSSLSMTKEQTLKEAAQMFDRYIYDDPNYIGPYWDFPGRKILRNDYKAINERIPFDSFENIYINNFHVDLRNKLYPSRGDLSIFRRQLLLQDFFSYLSTYSALSNFIEQTGDKENVMEKYLLELESKFGWDRKHTKIDVVWNSGYTFLHKK